MALVGLSEAARLTQKAHTTIHRAVRSGRLSASTNAAGQRQFDTSELDRVFGLRSVNGASVEARAPGVQRDTAHVREVEQLHARVAEQSEVIRSLSRRLEASEDERRAVQERLTALLTDQRPAAPVAPVATPAMVEARLKPPPGHLRPRHWWRRWFR
jgi:hypothetical protein